VVVYDFHIPRIAPGPSEANAPLIVDSYAVLALAVPIQRLEMISRRRPEVIQVLGIVQHSQLSPRGGLDVLWQPPGKLTAPYSGGFGA
jgi:hypothetical protein